MTSGTVYKICSAEDWRKAVREGRYCGAEIDLRDGFIHLSAPDQVRETAFLHMRGIGGLVLVSVAADRLGTSLKWETSRGGQLFPHLYGELPLEAVTDTRPLPLGDDGRHVFPDDL